MGQGSFELSNNSSIRVKGKSFDLNSFKGLSDILQKLTHENKTKNISVIGNFNTELQLNSIFSKANEIDEILSLLQHITRTIEESSIKFISHVNGVVRGPALELVLSCNYIKADTLKFLSLDGLYKALTGEKRNSNYPQFSDHYFTGDYPIKPNDNIKGLKVKQLSLLSVKSST